MRRRGQAPERVDFLADESCGFAVVRALRADGHDVAAVAEWAGGASDDRVLAMALESGRILLTEDKGFGQLVDASVQVSPGVVLIHFPAHARAQLRSSVVAAVRTAGARLRGGFIVIQPGRLRISRRPDD